MNYGAIKTHDIANGPGVRVSLFVSGCTHHCKGCFNQETWDFSYGEPYTDATMYQILDEVNASYIKGLTILGGEPFEHSNQIALLPLAKAFKEQYPDKTLWCYSGYTFDEDMVVMRNDWPETSELLSYIDVLVDGEFKEDLKNLNLRFRGSSNQRLIDVPKSLKAGEVILWDDCRTC